MEEVEAQVVESSSFTLVGSTVQDIQTLPRALTLPTTFKEAKASKTIGARMDLFGVLLVHLVIMASSASHARLASTKLKCLT